MGEQSSGNHSEELPDASKQDEALALARSAVEERRRILHAMGHELSESKVPSASMGIAFSGGGIRSATLSLGVAQALARQDRLLDFDYCSTVSGGGYFGSFLGSLFLPDTARGPDAAATSADAQGARFKSRFAHLALTRKARESRLRYGEDGDESAEWVRNPVWWLREHSRYLAPSGSSDYLVGATYMIRNWLAMLYVFALAAGTISVLMIGFSLVILSGWLHDKTGIGEPTAVYKLLSLSVTGAPVPCHCPKIRQAIAIWHLSPILLLMAIAATLALASSLAYWMSGFMSPGAAKPRSSRLQNGKEGHTPPTRPSSKQRLIASLLLTLLGSAGFILVWRTLVPPALPDLFRTPFADWSRLDAITTYFVIVVALAMLAILIASLRSHHFAGDAFTAEVRRRLTRANSALVGILLVLAILSLVDTLALRFYDAMATPRAPGSPTFWGGLSASVIAGLAWIINKMPSWFSDGESRIVRFLGKQIWTAALVIGVSMFGLLAILTHDILQYLLFDGHQWLAAEPIMPDVARSILIVGTLFILFFVTGQATGFVNLSSLHGIYASRLTRAFLGATNLNRLRKSADTDPKVNTSIKESDPNDQIAVDIYQQTRSPGPLHLINVTLNETKSKQKSQLLERDRKGVPVVFAPEGIFVDAGRGSMSARQYFSWETVSETGVESLSVGQLCAISGAAASSAMGSRTTLGGALALTFANIRLGYWWDVGDMVRGPITLSNRPGTWLYHRATRPVRTYFYLLNEMIANYSREYGRLNISDGGHFENSGAYELLRRNVRTIVVCDNGADQHYMFEDLELLVRKARIDLGIGIHVATAEKVQEIFGENGAELFLNGADKEWRQRVADRQENPIPKPEDRAFCLLLEIYHDNGDGPTLHGHLLWLKPMLFCGLPQDVVGYGTKNPTFPHETTGDQFFDEAQWESYRALGYAMMDEILSRPAEGINTIRHLNFAVGPA